MDCLPEDTLIYLFQYLNKRDLFGVSYVNKQWYSLIFERPETWIYQEFIVTSDQFFPEQAMKFMERCKIAKIDFSVEKDEDIVKFERILQFPWLIHVGLTRRRHNIPEDDDVLVLKKMPDQMNLKHLEIWTDKCYGAVLQLLQANLHSLEEVLVLNRWNHEEEQEMIQKYKESILSIKNLKVFRIHDILFQNDEEFDRFASAGHSLEELSIPDTKGFSKTSWDKLFSSSALKRLSIEKEGWGEIDYEIHDKDKFLINIREQPTLEDLTIGDGFPYSYDIIKSGMNTLKVLSICGLKNLDLSGLHLPNLEALDLTESDVSTLAGVFNACSDKLNQLSLREIEGTIAVTPKKKFENLKTIHTISYCDFSVVEYMFNAISSTELDDLTISDIEGIPNNLSLAYTSLLSNLERVSRVCASSDIFLALPEVTLPTINHLFINSGDFAIDDVLMERLVKCTTMKYLDLDEATSITVSDWIPRLVAAIPQLSTIRAERAKLKSTIDVSTITEETKLTSLYVDLTPLNVEQLTTILLKSPSLVRLGSTNFASSYDHLSAVYSLIDSAKPNIESHYIYVRDPPESPDVRLSYLLCKMDHNNVKFGVKYSFEHMVLITVASADGIGNTSYFDIDDAKIDWLAEMIISEDGLELKQQIVELMPSIVDQLDNIDAAKKHDIISRHSDPKNLPKYWTSLVEALMRNYASYAEGASRHYSSYGTNAPESYEEAKERMLKKHQREMKRLLFTQQNELEELEAKWKRKENRELKSDSEFILDDLNGGDSNDPLGQDSVPFSFDQV